MNTKDTPSHPVTQEIPRSLEALITDTFPSELTGRKASLPCISTLPSPRPTVTKRRQDLHTRLLPAFLEHSGMQTWGHQGKAEGAPG